MTDDPQDYWLETEAAKKIQGLFANQVYVQHLGSGLLRVNFGEVLDEDPRFHSAIVLTAENAYAFGALMQRMAQAAVAPPPSKDPVNVVSTPDVAPSEENPNG